MSYLITYFNKNGNQHVVADNFNDALFEVSSKLGQNPSFEIQANYSEHTEFELHVLMGGDTLASIVEVGSVGGGENLDEACTALKAGDPSKVVALFKPEEKPVMAPVSSQAARSLILKVPDFFKDPEFVNWLNNGKCKATWHQGGLPGDYSDTFVLVDPALNGEGTDSDMPGRIWDAIVDECKKHFRPQIQGEHIIVWLKQ